jgi:hypothetical protein
VNQIERYLASAKAELDGNGFNRICVWSEDNNDTTRVEVREYQTKLDKAKNEDSIQEHLQNHPSLVIGELGPQCHWVIPKKG